MHPTNGIQAQQNEGRIALGNGMAEQQGVRQAKITV